MGVLGKSRAAKKASPLKKVKLTWTRARVTDKKAVEDATKYIKKAVGGLHKLPRTYHGKPLSAADKGALGMPFSSAVQGAIKKAMTLNKSIKRGNPDVLAARRKMKLEMEKRKKK